MNLKLTRVLAALNATIVGASLADRTASNRWPSDHVDVVVKLNLRGQS